MSYIENCTPGGQFAAASGLDSILTFTKYPDLQLFMQRASLPAITAALPSLDGPRYQGLNEPPTKLLYEDLACTFLVQANYGNYLTVQKWMRDSMSEYKDTAVSDINQMFMTSDGIQVMQAKYIRALPYHLSALEYAIDTNDVQYLKATVLFKYNKYDVGEP